MIFNSIGSLKIPIDHSHKKWSNVWRFFFWRHFLFLQKWFFAFRCSRFFVLQRMLRRFIMMKYADFRQRSSEAILPTSFRVFNFMRTRSPMAVDLWLPLRFHNIRFYLFSNFSSMERSLKCNFFLRINRDAWSPNSVARGQQPSLSTARWVSFKLRLKKKTKKKEHEWKFLVKLSKLGSRHMEYARETNELEEIKDDEGYAKDKKYDIERDKAEHNKK